MKTIRLAGVGLILLTGAVAGAEAIDRVAAVIGDRVVLLSDLETATRTMISRFESQRGPMPAEYRRRVQGDALQGLIDRSLILNFAERRELVASEKEIDDAIAGIAQDEDVSQEQVYAAAEQQGLSRSAYRDELGNQITRMKVISGAVRSRVGVSEEEIREVFDERYRELSEGLRVRVRHILIPWPEDGSKEKAERMREIAETIRGRAIETGAFAALARQYSRAPSAMDGGLSTFKQGEIAADIAAHVFVLPVGEITPVIETEHGLNIFQIVNRFDPHEVRYEDVAEELHAELLERKTGPEYERWIAELRRTTYVNVVVPELQ